MLATPFRVATEIRAILWDLDGTLTNTEELKLQAHQETVRQLHGRWFATNERYLTLMGKSMREAVSVIMTECHVQGTYSDYLAIWASCYENLARSKAEAHPGAREVMRIARAHQMRQAIVSSSSRHEMDAVLKRAKLTQLVDGTVSSDDVAFPKPHPEPYLLGMRIAFGNRENGRAAEDTETGVASAQAAGLSVVAVRHDLNTHHVFRGVVRVLHVHDMANPERFFELLVAP